ncbi:hypothetical protein SDJN03_27210, partial [Cucurbita argyrosperma subsp. sororia]
MWPPQPPSFAAAEEEEVGDLCVKQCGYCQMDQICAAILLQQFAFLSPTLSSPGCVVEVVWESKWQGNSPLAKKQTNALSLAFGMNQMNGLIMFLPKENYTVIPQPQPYDFAISWCTHE